MTNNNLPRNKSSIANQRYGRLTAIEFSYSKNNRHHWLFLCDCGTKKILPKSQVKSKKTKSCGCLRLENNKTIGITHGKSKIREFFIWQGIKKRCLNENCRAYKYYGGRGIKICDRWLNSFENFLQDMGKSPTNKHSVDRIDNNGNYEPSNCRWATRTEQNNNTRGNKIVIYQDSSYTLSELCRKLNIKYQLVYDRVNKLNWSIEEAICL